MRNSLYRIWIFSLQEVDVNNRDSFRKCGAWPRAERSGRSWSAAAPNPKSPRENKLCADRRIWSAVAEVAPGALVSHQRHSRDRRHRFRWQLHLRMPTMRWGFEGTAASKSGVGGRENTKHKPSTFGATSATALQKRRGSSVEFILTDRLGV
jgi:hypothetical protein